MTEEGRNEEVREFVLDNYQPAHQWEPKMADDWVSWAADNGFLFLCYDEPGDKGKLVALGIARPLSLKRKIGEIQDTDFDLDGEVVYVDLTISTCGKQGVQAVMLGILQKMGDKPLFVFKRLKTKNKIKIHRLGDFANKLLTGKR